VVPPVAVTVDTACGCAAAAPGYAYVSVVLDPPPVIACTTCVNRFPVAVSYVKSSQNGAGPPNTDTDGVVEQLLLLFGVHTRVNSARWSGLQALQPNAAVCAPGPCFLLAI
jgi:hypothetical protein